MSQEFCYPTKKMRKKHEDFDFVILLSSSFYFSFLIMHNSKTIVSCTERPLPNQLIQVVFLCMILCKYASLQPRRELLSYGTALCHPQKLYCVYECSMCYMFSWLELHVSHKFLDTILVRTFTHKLQTIGHILAFYIPNNFYSRHSFSTVELHASSDW